MSVVVEALDHIVINVRDVEVAHSSDPGDQAGDIPRRDPSQFEAEFVPVVGDAVVDRRGQRQLGFEM